MTPLSILSCMALGSVPAARAQAPAGPPFRVNSHATGRQSDPQVVMTRDGFVVAWSEYGSPEGPEVFARRFTVRGDATGDEFRVNARTDGRQAMGPSGGGIARDGSDNLVVVWNDEAGASPDLLGRRVRSAGMPLGSDLQVNAFTTGVQRRSSVAMATDGRFVVTWADYNASDVAARRFDRDGRPLGDEFRVNTTTADVQGEPAVDMDSRGSFIVVWTSNGQDGPMQPGVFAQRFDAAGKPVGGEFQVNTWSTGAQSAPAVALASDGSGVIVWQGEGQGTPPGFTDVWARRLAGDGIPVGAEFRVNADATPASRREPAVDLDDEGRFVVAWQVLGPGGADILARRFDAAGGGRGGDFRVTTAPDYSGSPPSLAMDRAGNFVVAWSDPLVDSDVLAQRFGGLRPSGLQVLDLGNGVLEAGDMPVFMTSWRNESGAAQTFQGSAVDVVAPPGLALTLSSQAADYGTVDDGGIGSCGADCLTGMLLGTRPTGHVDLTLVERIQPDVQGQSVRWKLHVGDSFRDVPRASPYYRFVETLLHHGAAAGAPIGCAADAYCPDSYTTREQMALFMLGAREGTDYVPPACTTRVFRDVPETSPYCRWIEELARRGVVVGCAAGNYCPDAPVTREQMAVFVLRTLDPAFDPPACATPRFADVPVSSPYCRWIQQLAWRGVVIGCGGRNYCPQAPVTREQMAVFISVTFGLTLYGP